MPNDLLFKPLRPARSDTVCIYIEDMPHQVPIDISVAAALLGSGHLACRTTPVKGAPRAPFCMMGVCFDCLLEIDGLPNRQGCMTVVREGMRVRSMLGARSLS
jgi:hypothetical protein